MGAQALLHEASMPANLGINPAYPLNIFIKMSKLTILWPISTQNVQFSSFPEKNKNVTFLHSLKLAFMQKIREIQFAVFEKMRKTFDFGHF